MTYRQTPCDWCGCPLIDQNTTKEKTIRGNVQEVYSETCSACNQLLYGWVKMLK